MIFGNVKCLDDYSFLSEQIKKCFAYAADNNLKNADCGSYKIDEDALYVNVISYDTSKAEDRFWEAHKKYLDIHLMLQGVEQIDLNFLQSMALREYVPEKDFLPMDGESNSSVLLAEDDFLICYPTDAHRPGVAVGESQKVKKAVFKVLIP